LKSKIQNPKSKIERRACPDDERKSSLDFGFWILDFGLKGFCPDDERKSSLDFGFWIWDFGLKGLCPDDEDLLSFFSGSPL